MVARLVDQAFENPATSGGLLVMALTASAIVSNALFLQGGHHPDPFFAPRPVEVGRTSQVPKAAGATPIGHSQPPLPHLSPVPRASATPAVTTTQTEAPRTGAELVAAIQRELAGLGLYGGTIDGLPGPRTSRAISTYERAAGLRPTGHPTTALLEALKQPLPSADVGPLVPQTASDPIAARLDQRQVERGEAIAQAQRAQATIRMHENYRIVQNALNRIGYGPVSVTGDIDAETADAIRRFELDNGMPLTGEVGEPLLARLVAIGAIRPG